MNGTQGAPASATDSFKVRSRFFAPPAQFDGCFTTFYRMNLEIDGDGEVADYLQPEWGNIRFFAGARPSASIGNSSCSGARFVATGPSSLPNKFSIGSASMWGIGWARFLDVDAMSVVNQVMDGERHPAFEKFAGLSDILCDASCSEEEQFDAIVETMQKLARPHRDEAKIVRVHRAMVDTKVSSVADFADRSGMSVRTLERLCRRYFGFAPKLLMRRQRFMRSLTEFLLHRGKKWTDVMDEHYHDQAQFTREFHEFMTMNPTEYAALDHPILSSFMEARARIWGSAAQTLDKPD